MSAFEDVLEQVQIAHTILRDGRCYEELGPRLFDVADAVLEGAEKVLAGLSELDGVLGKSQR